MKKIIFVIVVAISLIACKKDKVDPIITNFNYHSGSLPIKSIVLDKVYFQSQSNVTIMMNYTDGSTFNSTLIFQSVDSKKSTYLYTVVLQDGSTKTVAIEYVVGIVDQIDIDTTVFLQN